MPPHHNCIKCFFDIQKVLDDKADSYEAKYDNIRPVFKAGLHFGPVMAGEVGVVKRDIAYSGDVLNTTARIQSKCNELGVEILVSNSLRSRLGEVLATFNPREIGQILLRGKQESVLLYTLAK